MRCRVGNIVVCYSSFQSVCLQTEFQLHPQQFFVDTILCSILYPYSTWYIFNKSKNLPTTFLKNSKGNRNVLHLAAIVAVLIKNTQRSYETCLLSKIGNTFWLPRFIYNALQSSITSSLYIRILWQHKTKKNSQA